LVVLVSVSKLFNSILPLNLIPFSQFLTVQNRYENVLKNIKSNELREMHDYTTRSNLPSSKLLYRSVRKNMDFSLSPGPNLSQAS